MRKSIGRKVNIFISTMGILILLVCIVNITSLSTIKSDQQAIAHDVDALSSASVRADDDMVAEATTDLNNYLSQITANIHKVYVFNIGLVVVGFLVYFISSLIIYKTITKPAKDATHSLNHIIEKIEKSEGDLTQRINVTSSDEIGQLSEGINGFVSNLQTLMVKLQEESDKMMASATEISQHVGDSNQSALSISSSMEELAASMEEVSATIDHIATGSANILDQLEAVSIQADNGAEMVASIKGHATEMHSQTLESKNYTTATFKEISDILSASVEESKNV